MAGGLHTCGQCTAIFSASFLTMPALMLNKSSRVMPGLRGTPAGMTTTSASFRHAGRFSSPVWPVTYMHAIHMLTKSVFKRHMLSGTGRRIECPHSVPSCS